MDIIKTEIERCNRMFDDGFSLITVGADKVPNIKWKEYQTTPMNKDTFFNFYQLASTAGSWSLHRLPRFRGHRRGS